MCFISVYSFCHTGEPSTERPSPATGGSAWKGRAPTNFQSLLTARCRQRHRTQGSIPALLSVPASAAKGSTQQVMGRIWGGMQITKVPFQPRALPERWHSLPDQHCSRSRPQPLAVTAVPHAKLLPVATGQGAAGHLYLPSGPQGQKNSIQVIHKRLLGPLHDSMYKKT